MTTTRTRRKQKSCPSTSQFEPLEQRRLLSAGDLDLSFGNAGKLAASVGFAVADMAVQADGKMVFVGHTGSSGQRDFAVARMLPSGALDTTFGGTGRVTTNFGGNQGDFASAVAIQPDGKIVVVGTSEHFESFIFSRNHDFAVARYNPDGSLDRSFAGNGRSRFGIGGYDRATAVQLMPDGRIVIAGTRDSDTVGGSRRVGVARLHANGALDQSFGSPLSGNRRTGFVTTNIGNGINSVSALLIQEDLNVVVGGTTTDRQFALARFRTNGMLDKTFNGNGRLASDMGPSATLRDLTLQGNRIIAAGGSNGNFAIARFLPNGRLDGTFNSMGRVVTNLGGADTAAKVFFTSEEKILAVGASDRNHALARYNHDGTLDTSFGTGGTMTTPSGAGGNISGTTAHYTRDGRVLAVAGARLARFIDYAPSVEVVTLRHASENGDVGRFIFFRNSRADIATTINFTVGGTATPLTDYTGLTRAVLQSITIPAGETFVVRDINAIDDGRMEPTETAIVTLRADQSYDIGTRRRAIMNIYDNDTLRINFQPEDAPVPSGFRADTGAVFGNRGNGWTYGWDEDNSAQTRDRNVVSNQALDTLTHLQKDGADRRWELAVPNGAYSVRIVSSDPSFFDGHWRLNIEDSLALDHEPSEQQFFAENRIAVNVDDGRLTISNAAGGINNKLAFIEVRSAEFVAPPPPPPPTAPGTPGGGQVLASSNSTTPGSMFSTTPIRVQVLD